MAIAVITVTMNSPRLANVESISSILANFAIIRLQIPIGAYLVIKNGIFKNNIDSEHYKISLKYNY